MMQSLQLNEKLIICDHCKQFMVTICEVGWFSFFV